MSKVRELMLQVSEAYVAYVVLLEVLQVSEAEPRYYCTKHLHLINRVVSSYCMATLCFHFSS